jgi:hypothetical protein
MPLKLALQTLRRAVPDALVSLAYAQYTTGFGITVLC